MLRGVGWRGQIAIGHRGGIRGRGQINRYLPFRLERSRQKEISTRRKRGNWLINVKLIIFIFSSFLYCYVVFYPSIFVCVSATLNCVCFDSSDQKLKGVVMCRAGRLLCQNSSELPSSPV